MAGRHLEVDQRISFPVSIPRRDRMRADLELQSSRHTVAREVHVGGRILTVRVKIDEAGRDDESPDVGVVSSRNGGRH